MKTGSWWGPWTLIAAVSVGGVASGQPLGLGSTGEDLVSVEVLVDDDRVGPGQTFHLAFVFAIEPKWHIYWKNPGAGAMPPRIEVKAPAGFEVGEPLWPRPSVKATQIGAEYFYADEAAIFVPVKAPGELADGRVTFAARIDWAVCKDVCKLGGTSRSVVVETSSRPDCTDCDPRLVKHRKQLPKTLADVPGASISFDGEVLTVTGPARGLPSATFFPGYSPGVSYGEPAAGVRDDRFTVSVEVELNAANAQGRPMVLDGLVALGGRRDDPCYDFRIPAAIMSSRSAVAPRDVENTSDP